MSKMRQLITMGELRKLSYYKQVMFALFCAERVTKYLDDKTREPALKAIEVTKLWLEGKATQEKCRDAADAVYVSIAAYAAHDTAEATHAAYAIAYAVAYTAYAIVDAADAVTYVNAVVANTAHAVKADVQNKIIEDQWHYYDQLLNIDKYAEEMINE